MTEEKIAIRVKVNLTSELDEAESHTSDFGIDCLCGVGWLGSLEKHPGLRCCRGYHAFDQDGLRRKLYASVGLECVLAEIREGGRRDS